MSLSDKYRPTSLPEIVGQVKAVALASRFMGNVWPNRPIGVGVWIVGPTGTGKTTIARILCNSVAEVWNQYEIDARTLTPRDLADLEHDYQSRRIGKLDGVTITINEAHGLSKGTIEALLTVLERLPRHVLVVFTTTWDGAESLEARSDDFQPLTDRCFKISTTNQGQAPAIVAHIRRVGELEGLIGAETTDKQIARVVQNAKNSIRGALASLDELVLA